MNAEQLIKEFNEWFLKTEEEIMSGEQQAERAIQWMRERHGDGITPEIEAEVRGRYSN